MEVFVSRREKQNIIQVQAEMCLGCIDWRKLSPNIHHISNISLSLSVSSLFFFFQLTMMHCFVLVQQIPIKYTKACGPSMRKSEKIQGLCSRCEHSSFEL